MTSTLRLLGSYLGAQARALHDGVVRAIVSFDPEGASEAQIREHGRQVDKLADIAALALRRAGQDEAAAKALDTRFVQFRRAAQLLSEQVDGAADADRATKERALERVLADAEALKAERDRAREDALDSRGYADERAAQLKLAVDAWKQARDRLAAATREQQRARDAARRASDRARGAASSAGLADGVGANGSVPMGRCSRR